MKRVIFAAGDGKIVVRRANQYTAKVEVYLPHDDPNRSALEGSGIRVLVDPDGNYRVYRIAPWADGVPRWEVKLVSGSLLTLPESDPDADPNERPRSSCGCGFDIVYTGDGWQHDAAPWFWGDDHEPDVDAAAEAAAQAWDVAHPDIDEHLDTTVDECGVYDLNYWMREGGSGEIVGVLDLVVGQEYTDHDGRWTVESVVRVGTTVHVKLRDAEGNLRPDAHTP